MAQGSRSLGRPPLLASLGVAHPQALPGVEMEGDELREELEHADRLKASNAQIHRRRAIILRSTDTLRCAASGAIASWAAAQGTCGYNSSDAAVGGHAPIR